MLNVSDDFKTASKAPVRQYQARIIVLGEDSQTISSSDNLASIKIESAGNYFSSAATNVTVKIFGTDWNLEGANIQVEKDIKLSNGSWGTSNYGVFTIIKQQVNLEKECTELTCANTMGTLQSTLYDSSIGFPCTVAEMAASIAAKFDLTLDDMTSLPNTDYIIQQDLYANDSEVNFRDIVAEIAGTTASMAVVDDVYRKLVFRPLQKEVQETLTYDNLIKATHDAHYGPVNSVVLSRTPQEDNIVLKDDESIAANGLTELKLANNEIMDDEREVFAEPILEVVDGWEWTGFEITTEGHGWHQVGDRIVIQKSETEVWEGIITNTSETIDGGDKEILKGVIPTETVTDYALAGGIIKTIYNTQIKVDKQNQQIESIVSKQEQLEGETNESYTRLIQSLTEIIASVQNSGGNNLLKNSAMYARDENNNPTYWTLSSAGTISIMPSADATAHGSLSGQIIQLTGKTISQAVTVKADDDSIAEDYKTYYTFTCRIKKSGAGTGYIQLSDGSTTRKVTIGNGSSPYYTEYAIEAFLPKNNTVTLTVYGSSDSDFTITDMMLAVGNYRSSWTQANGEFNNTQVQIDTDGVTVRSSNIEGTYVQETPQGLSIYKENQLVATISNTEVSAPEVTATTSISMPPIKIVAQSDGWAFVPTGS